MTTNVVGKRQYQLSQRQSAGKQCGVDLRVGACLLLPAKAITWTQVGEACPTLGPVLMTGLFSCRPAAAVRCPGAPTPMRRRGVSFPKPVRSSGGNPQLAGTPGCRPGGVLHDGHRLELPLGVQEGRREARRATHEV